jgi:hypothetical protein
LESQNTFRNHKTHLESQNTFRNHKTHLELEIPNHNKCFHFIKLDFLFSSLFIYPYLAFEIDYY